MKSYSGGRPDADAGDLPVTWRDDVHDDPRPCDRCPADGRAVFWSGGREWCLCEDCFHQVQLGR